MEKNVVVANGENLGANKQIILDGGVEKFHVLADFDGTLTKIFVSLA
jgi:hypothetical protein